MAECDRHTIERGTAESDLVARAGAAVAAAAVRVMGGTYGRRVVVAAGPGNNGADGRVAARLLSGKGAQVRVVDVAGSSADGSGAERALARADLLIDAMYGTGLRDRLDGLAATIARTAERVAAVLAVDLPSGVHGLTGESMGPVARATATVTFAAPKPAHYLEPGRSLCGEVEVALIGVETTEVPPPGLWVLDGSDVAALVPDRDPRDHKWSAATYIVGGSQGMTGAPALAARAAMRAGAGMVVCAVPMPSVGAIEGSEFVVRGLRADSFGCLAVDAAAPVLVALERFGALVVGPGLGRTPSIVDVVGSLVAESEVPVVIDADGLVALAGNPAALRVRQAAGAPFAVVTPHAGEYARLAGRPLPPDRVDAARQLADDLPAVVVLKGPGTVVALPGGEAYLTPTGGPQLATPGTGDVLAGTIGALLARGLDGGEAAAAGAWWHGRAGDRLVPGAVASDVADSLAPTLAAIRSEGTG